MAGICSAHMHLEEGCWLCSLAIEDVIPNWRELHAQAEAAGLHDCEGCNFRYYKTVDLCPKCNKYREP